MPVVSENKYIQALFETLISSYETEINYNPIEINIDPNKIAEHDINALISFVTAERKRLFLFTIPDNEATTTRLKLISRRAVLDHTAKKLLKNTNTQTRVNPLKIALNNPATTISAGIQIQKSFIVPMAPVKDNKTSSNSLKHHQISNVTFAAIDLQEFPVLTKQLAAIGIQQIQDSATQKIKEHPHAFTDGIIPQNLPSGFYIDKKNHALCFTENPLRLPSALAPVLEIPHSLKKPTFDQAKSLVQNMVNDETIIQLLNDDDIEALKNVLLTIMPSQSKEVNHLFQTLKPSEQQFIIPLLAKYYILGGEEHTILFIRLLNAANHKKINLDFLNSSSVQDAFLTPRGIKNLQKLIYLPAEQRDWWNTLCLAHLNNKQHHFDFNTFFEAYTQIFLAQIADKNLTLPNPCPIKHDGHLLITLNRVIEVLNSAENPQEQCLSLQGLNWGPTGVHFAMTQLDETNRLKQGAACMELNNPEDAASDPGQIYNQLEQEELNLSPWMYRFMAKYWKKDIRLNDIQDQLNKIRNTSWPQTQKNKLIYILVNTFSSSEQTNLDLWIRDLNNCINTLNGLDTSDRNSILMVCSKCFKFKPRISLSQIQQLITESLELKNAFPEKDFQDEILNPLFTCLENEGFGLHQNLQERIEKTAPEDNKKQFCLNATLAFYTTLKSNLHNLDKDSIKILACLNLSELVQEDIDALKESLAFLTEKRGPHYAEAVIHTLSQINITKSQALPTNQTIQKFICTIADDNTAIPEDLVTLEKQSDFLKDLIIDKNLLPGCVLGNGDISKLDDLMVDALVDAFNKRSAALDIKSLKISLKEELQSPIVPGQLRDKLDITLMPVLDALHELITLLQQPSPKFDEVIEKLHFFEQKKPMLLSEIYSVSVLGQSKGEHLLSYIITGKRKADDNLTNRLFSMALSKINGLFISKMNEFFSKEENIRMMNGLDAKTIFSWMEQFNETHSLTFLFEEELVQKKVLPALKKTLQQLSTQDLEFENSILKAAGQLDDSVPCDQSLNDYRIKIESIANYLNLLIDIKDKAPIHFNTIYKQLQTDPLARLNYQQKQELVSQLLDAKADRLDTYLKYTTQALEDNPDANLEAIERAINGLKALFELSDLEPETEMMFFRMSLAHNLKSRSPFPLASLNELKKSELAQDTKSAIIKNIINILSRMTPADSPELIQKTVKQTQTFLTENPELNLLCIGLLKRVSLNNLNRDLDAFTNILNQLNAIKKEYRDSLAVILTGLAHSLKDDTVNLPTLLDIAKGLGRPDRSVNDLGRVERLFATPPFPIAQTLNSTLQAHDSIKLHHYCDSFDTNPFIKNNESRPLATHFATHRIEEALNHLKDLMRDVTLPHSLQLQLAKELTYIELLGYTDPLNPNDFSELKKLTAMSRVDLKNHAIQLLNQIRNKEFTKNDIEQQLELLAYMREIYFRTSGLFPNSTQMLVLLLSLHLSDTNLLMRISTGEGKSLNTPMLAVLQWTKGGTVDVCTANRTLLRRDYENNGEAFLKFLDIESGVIESNSHPKDYKLDGINFSTVEDMSLFRLAAKEAKQEAYVQNGGMVHVVLDECDDALLDQTTLYKLVAENADSIENNAQWIYPLANQFIKLPAFKNLHPNNGAVWDEEEDLEQFRLFLNKQINERFNGDAEKQNFMLATSNTQLKQWLKASCKAAKLVENKHFVVQPIKEKDDAGNEVVKKIACVPLVRSTPKPGCIFTGGIQQALQARLKAERPEQAHYFAIDMDPPVLASQSARGLIGFYQKTKGRLLGISGTPGDKIELEYLSSLLGTQAIGVAPYAGDKRTKHPSVFTFSPKEKVTAIKNAINRVRQPMTKPVLEINPDNPIQTFEEKEAFITQTKGALEDWSRTQTQPILIVCEDFDDAKKMGVNLEPYKKQGYKIQVVTGKERPEDLERIIKQAGKANTITIGTAMLARGIDINPGAHPKGLFCIQVYPDSERMSTQISGRASRNGKPGDYLPIYEVNPPNSLLDKIIYYLFPGYYQKKCHKIVEKIQAKIKLQASIDRLYTQAVDQAQQVLIQQIDAWENLLLELYPADPKLQHELYQWRESLLSELAHAQETNISEKTLDSSIAQFKHSLNKLWETLREEKWVAKAQKVSSMTLRQSIQLKYLKQIDLHKEFDTQAPLQEKSRLITAGTEALRHQHLHTMIQDKAGVALEYSQVPEENIQHFKLAQSKQLLPGLIGMLCEAYPNAINPLTPKTNNAESSSFIPTMLLNLVQRFIDTKNKALLKSEDTLKITQALIQFYHNDLKHADAKKIQSVLLLLKPLIIEYGNNLLNLSIIEQFKMRGIILTYYKLYEHSGLEKNEQLAELNLNYGEEMIRSLARYLMNEFFWTKESPTSLTTYLERKVAFNAAKKIYELAKEVSEHPQNAGKIQALYVELQAQKIKLADVSLFSIRHASPRNVINVALSALEAVHSVPHCSHAFQSETHDKILSEHHLNRFRIDLNSLSIKVGSDPVWDYLSGILQGVCEQNTTTSHLVFELSETIERFKTYPSYKPYTRYLNKLSNSLKDSIKQLSHVKNGLKQNYQDSLFTVKETQFADLLKIDAEKIRIKNSSDGIHSFIEVQIEGAPVLEGFTGYQTSYLSTIDTEKKHIEAQKIFLQQNKEMLGALDIKTIEALHPLLQPAFRRLYDLKSLLQIDLSKKIDAALMKQLPEELQTTLSNAQKLFTQSLTDSSLDIATIKKLSMQDSFDDEFIALADHYSSLIKLKDSFSAQETENDQQIDKLDKKIKQEESKIHSTKEHLESKETGFFGNIKLKYQEYSFNSALSSLQTMKQELLSTKKLLQQKQIQCNDDLEKSIQSIDENRLKFADKLLKQAKEKIKKHIDVSCSSLITKTELELSATESSCDELKKTELSKLKYQTKRFFKPAELLNYEAALKHEKSAIPQPNNKESDKINEGLIAVI